MTGNEEATPIEGADQGIEPRNALLRLADQICIIAAGIVLLGMMVMTFTDVLGRYLFNAPLGFAFEMTQLAMATVVFFGIPSVTLRGLHITVDLVENIFHGGAKLVRDVIVTLAIAVCLGYLAWRLSTLSARFISYGEITSTVRFPIGYIAWLGTAMLALASVFALINVVYEITLHQRQPRK